ncbi:hypothetical protein BEWA_025950 [Theileria equi strain WA]|uniref:Uncharacterized protein n=1 Tax=Theileria equi strain WA TaxID=1537102 RepID=L0AXJ7_THEEQ|nr:hypothetical protein BEWA_025950 [Theileria equi strain WA]AFZ79746.1 hypothetical protein BEWA_025950 [Theileria equi strain WA]|eukprot:XP_004829412.1 hypothetical protein BEWA_025950 [Theileria equi strain WA]
MHRYMIDVSPNVTAREGIKCDKNNEIAGYESFRYTSSDGQPFYISVLYFNGRPLKGIILSIIRINYLKTYFKEDKLLLIHIVLYDATNIYYLNQDTTAEVGDVTFTEITPQSKQPIDTSELTLIFSNIETNGGFNFPEFYRRDRSTALQIFSDLDLVFNLERTSLGSGPNNYLSEISTRNIALKENEISNGSFKKVKHALVDKSFKIKGIKLRNGNYMKVKGGLPTGILEGFNVYYRDSDYSNPLLVELLEICPLPDNYVKTKFYLTMNEDDGRWDIRKIFSVVDEKTELPTLLQNIVTHNRLMVDGIIGGELKNKLYDIRQCFSIDLTQVPSLGRISYYLFDGMCIPYRREKDPVGGYYLVRHATIPHFTIQRIKVTKTKELTEDNIPPLGTLFGRLNAYYTDNSYKDVVLIELECLEHSEFEDSPIFFYYYSNDGKDNWTGYELETTVSDEDGLWTIPDKDALIAHIKENDNKIIFERLKKELTGKLTMYSSSVSDKKRKEQDIVKEIDKSTEKRESTESMPNSKFAPKSEHDIHSGEKFDALGCGIGVTFGIIAICVGIYLVFPSIKRFTHHHTIQKFMYRRCI